MTLGGSGCGLIITSAPEVDMRWFATIFAML